VHEKRVILRNPTGLHARPAELFAREAGRFASDVTVRKDSADDGVDAKSVLSILTLDCLHGDEIVIAAVGEDAEEAIAHLSRLVEDGLGEDLIG
jgi:phosphocarrier protein HPr